MDRVSGGQGNDTIHGIGSAADAGNGGTFDVAYGGQGNDTIGIVGTNFSRIDGGLGADTLKIETSAGLNLNFATLGSKVQGIETIDLTSGNNTISLRLSDVLQLPEQSGTSMQRLTIMGDAGDVVNLLNGSGGTWSTSSTATIGTDVYNVYSHSSLAAPNHFDDVLVKQGMAVNVV